jgi:hypothetical protein
LGEQAKAGVVKADAVTNDTAKIGINIVGFIVVSIDWPCPTNLALPSASV